MERAEPLQFMASKMFQKNSKAPYCFDKCIKSGEIGKELTRDQDYCLGSPPMI